LPEYSSDEINLRNQFAGKGFSQLEGYLNDFLNYVPLDKAHLSVYSPRLCTIILEAGPELISAFDVAVATTKLIPTWEWTDETLKPDRDRLWEKEENLKKRHQSLSFDKYYQFLNSHGLPRLDSATVEIADFNAYFMPFEKRHPYWWKTYNELKHEKYSNLKKAKLKTTLKFLGALFWLINHNMNLILRNECQSRLFKIIDKYSPRIDGLRKI
jgi:hypothetical protein